VVLPRWMREHNHLSAGPRALASTTHHAKLRSAALSTTPPLILLLLVTRPSGSSTGPYATLAGDIASGRVVCFESVLGWPLTHGPRSARAQVDVKVFRAIQDDIAGRTPQLRDRKLEPACHGDRGDERRPWARPARRMRGGISPDWVPKPSVHSRLSRGHSTEVSGHRHPSRSLAGAA
jgi:hypothetical protein